MNRVKSSGSLLSKVYQQSTGRNPDALVPFPRRQGAGEGLWRVGGVTHKADGFVGEVDVETNDLASCNIK